MECKSSNNCFCFIVLHFFELNGTSGMALACPLHTSYCALTLNSLLKRSQL